jgi:hypothetical protein
MSSSCAGIGFFAVSRCNQFLWRILSVLWGIEIALKLKGLIRKTHKKTGLYGEFLPFYGELELYYTKYSLICGNKFLSIRHKINFYGEFLPFYGELKNT